MFYVRITRINYQTTSSLCPEFPNPYYREEGSKKKTKKLWNQLAQDDQSKITIAFKVLNDFINYINEEYKCACKLLCLNTSHHQFGEMQI